MAYKNYILVCAGTACESSKGIALYNPNNYSVNVPLGGAYYQVSPQGGHSPKLGGTGTSHSINRASSGCSSLSNMP